MANITRAELAGLMSGNNYVVAMKRQTTLLTGGLRLLISNPAGSGRNLVLTSIKTYSFLSAVGNLYVYRNPTSNLPTGTPTAAQVVVSNLNYGSPNTTVALVKFNVDAVSTGMEGATEIEKIAITLNSEGEIDPPARLVPPGGAIGFRLDGVALDVSMQVVYIEQRL